jgi:hypothetical protein
MNVLQVQAVMYPLLGYATNLSNPEAEVLIEEALKCWGVAPAVSQPAYAIGIDHWCVFVALQMCCRCKQ